MKKLIFTILLTLSAIFASAQNVSVGGLVRDSKGEPVVGAIVILKGSTSVGSVTDSEGRYSISVPAGSTLEVSCLGFKSQTTVVGKSRKIDFTLQDDAVMIEDAVVVGYGSMRKSDLTGSVASVRIDEERSSRSTTLDQLLDGTASGVQVVSDNSNPDAGVSIRIRGISTFSGHSEPLYVVDGVIVEGETSEAPVFDSAIGDNVANERESTNALAGINPQDIESIQVLKDASATAIYGSQAANGVVIITTKQASKDMPTVNFNSGISIGQAGKRSSLLSFDEYADMVYKYNTSGTYKKILYSDPENRKGLKVTPVNWEDYVTRTSVSQRYYVSVAGKPNGLNYHFSLGYNINQGILKQTDSDSFTSKLSLSKEVFNRLKLSFKTAIGYTSSNLVNGANSIGSSKNYNSIISSLQCVPFIADDDELSEVISDSNERRGPIKLLEGNTNTSQRIRVTPSIVADVKILKFLSFRSTFGADAVYSQGRKTKDYNVSYGHGNIAGRSEAFSLLMNWDNIFLLNWKKGRHTLSGTVGQSYSRKMKNFNTVSAEDLPQRYAYGDDINYATPEKSYYTAYGETISTLLSFFGRAVYNYSDRYILTATLRADGSSKFRGINKWGIFPSAAAAWRIASEPWFNVNCISNMKLRLGWGQVGNQNIGDYLTGTIYVTDFNSSHYDTGKILGIYGSNIANAGLKWETTTQENVGLDFGMFRGRLTLTVDAYNKDTKDLLQNKSVAYSTGFTKMYVNDGWIRNSGIEINLEGVPVKTKKVEWMIGANMSINRNRVRSVGEMGDSGMIFLDDHSPAVQCNYFFGDKVFNSTCSCPVNIFIEGQPLALFYGYKVDGIVQEGEKAAAFSKDTYRDEGTLKFKDLNGNGFIDEGDRTVLGNPNPKFTYGFSSSFSISNFTLRLDFSGAYKFDIANMNNVLGYYTNFSKNCYREAFVNAWTPETPNNEWPKFGAAVDDLFCDRYVEDGTYFKISNISLSYVLRLKKKSKILKAIAFTGSVGNPYIWTRYSGYNPTTNSFGDDIRRFGIDLNSSPYARTYNFDIKFRF